MNRFLTILLVASVLPLFFTKVSNAMTCEAQFIDMKPHYELAKLAAQDWADKAPPKQIVSVLSAIGENGLPMFDVRGLQKNGKILLGLKSQGQEPVLAIYRFDGSVEGSEFRLVELRQKTSGNTNSVISEMPVDKATGQLFPEVAAHPAVAAVRRNLALGLGPEVTNYIRETGEWFDFATAKDLRDLSEYSSPTSALRMLHMRMRGRWVKEVLSKDLLKQIFRGVLLGGVVFGSSYLAQKFSESEEKVQKTILDSMAALLLIELANLEADAKLQIPDMEREQIVKSAIQIAMPSSQGEVLKLSQIEIASTTKSISEKLPGTNVRAGSGPEKFWVLDRPSGRIFVGLAEASSDITLESSNGEVPRVEINTRALVEISAKEMPVTYKIASGKFNSLVEKENAK